VQVAVELLIDTGRRPAEICGLAWDCLARDDDGSPVLVYDNRKAYRDGRRLPVGEITAQIIIEQKKRARHQYPDTPAGELVLLPSPTRNRYGRRAMNSGWLDGQHRDWVDAMPPLLLPDGTEYPRSPIFPYAYRHTYAQQHADADVPVDVLRELLDHVQLDTTRQYYRVGEKRRRDAVSKVTAMQFSRQGDRIWAQARDLLDTEHARRAIGEVAVPYGVYAEPSNVRAGGRACPYRFRCAGCDHFRTDVSYLPDLQAYLDDLLRSRERLLAAADIDDWAGAEALPSQEEIGRIRTLISRSKTDLGQLSPGERSQVDEAVAVVRRHRTVMLGMPRVRRPSPVSVRRGPHDQRKPGCGEARRFRSPPPARRSRAGPGGRRGRRNHRFLCRTPAAVDRTFF
jgi:Phage integrase family